MLRTALPFVLLSPLVLLTGCGGNDGPPTYPVSGTVTYQGKPLAKGQIAFRPDAKQGGTGPMHAANIENGQFSLEATEGPKRVEIYGSWEIPGKFILSDDGSGKKFPAMASVPPTYNEMSKLDAMIKPEENAGLEFDLK